MNAKSRPSTTYAVALLCLFGCGGDDDANEGGVSIDELPAQISKKICAEVASCYDARSLAQLFGEDGCEERFAAQLEDGDFAHLKAAIDDGRVDYDAKQAERCLEQLEGLGCEFATTRLLGVDACDRAFGGHTKLGDDCEIDAECQGQAFCLRGSSCPGSCSELLGPGETCERGDNCEDGLTCDDSHKCAAPVADGKACGGDVAAECRAGLACIGEGDDGSAGTCREYAAIFVGSLGDTCDFDTGKLCDEGLSCVVDSIAAGGAAKLVCAKPSASGAACKFGAPTPCPAGEYCNADIKMGKIAGSCTPLPDAGEACASVAGSSCLPGLRCESDSRCHPVNRLGQPCVSDQGCSSRRCVSGRCERPEACEL